MRATLARRSWSARDEEVGHARVERDVAGFEERECAACGAFGFVPVARDQLDLGAREIVAGIERHVVGAGGTPALHHSARTAEVPIVSVRGRQRDLDRCPLHAEPLFDAECLRAA